MKIKVGDNVIVLTGDHKGSSGKILKVFRAKNTALVEGVNLVKKHNRPTQSGPGGIDTKEAAIQLSNLMIEDPKDGAPTRVGFKIEDGKKVRFAKKSGELIDG